MFDTFFTKDMHIDFAIKYMLELLNLKMVRISITSAQNSSSTNYSFVFDKNS